MWRTSETNCAEHGHCASEYIDIKSGGEAVSPSSVLSGGEMVLAKLPSSLARKGVQPCWSKSPG